MESVGAKGGVASPAQRKILLTGDCTLSVQANLLRADYHAFEAACDRLCSSPQRAATLDLTRCTYLSSMFIGALVDTVIQMQVDGKAVRILVSAEIGRFLNMAHLYHLFAYEIVMPPGVPV